MQLFKTKSTSPLADEILIADFKRSGDTKIIGELFKRYAHLVLGVCMKYMKDADEAQDLTMQVFEKLLIDFKNHEVSNFKGWLYMVAKNQCLMQLRKEKGHKTVTFETNKEAEDEGGMEKEFLQHPDDADWKEVQLQAMEEGIQYLNGGQKVCIELFYLQNKSYVEVSDITGYDMNQVKSFIQNGKRNLKIFIEKKNAG